LEIVETVVAAIALPIEILVPVLCIFKDNTFVFTSPACYACKLKPLGFIASFYSISMVSALYVVRPFASIRDYP
jgi:hypothetical protein